LRVLNRLGIRSIQLRQATPGDAGDLHAWRSHPSIQARSLNQAKISRADHDKWFAAVLTSADRVLLIAERSSKPLGVIRFDLASGIAEVSIYLVPGVEEPGLGGELLSAAQDWLEALHPEMTTLQAKVLGSNSRSHQLFLGQGYQPELVTYTKELKK
jgi:RimJ/RimL family protein N-acetyltransferase